MAESRAVDRKEKREKGRGRKRGLTRVGERERKQAYLENVDTFSIRNRTNTCEGVAVVGE